MKSKTSTGIEFDWNEYAKQYDHLTIGGANPAYLQLRDKIVADFTNDAAGDEGVIVDLGGGTGNISLVLASKFKRSKFIIVDSSPAMLKRAQSKAREMGLNNVETRSLDMENIEEIAREESRPITHTLIVHSLYATRSKKDPDKPKRILDEVFKSMVGDTKKVIIADINRPVKMLSWSVYCLKSMYQHAFAAKKNGLHALLTTKRFLAQTKIARSSNAYLIQQQKNGNFLLCDLETLVSMVKNAGFNTIQKASNSLYRGVDNYVVATN